MPNHQAPRTQDKSEDHEDYDLHQAIVQEASRISPAPSPTPTPIPKRHVHEWGHYNLYQNLRTLHNDIMYFSMTSVTDYKQLYATWLKIVFDAANLLSLRCNVCNEPVGYPEATAKAKELIEKFGVEYQPGGSLPGRDNLRRLGAALRGLIWDVEGFF
ncbi:hypothetical protein B7494_g5461 [Chlorociboria aeruginascens]|nr:hypothetical protein B7494_g5461 [Chlorociboria aeruginascens]